MLEESFEYDQIEVAVRKDASGRTLRIILEKYALFLLRQHNQKGTALAKNSILSYFGQTKNELLALAPEQETLVRSALLRMTGQVDKFCAKRGGTQVERQAPPCTKQDLVSAVTALYTSATTTRPYFDGALLNLMWFLFGRSSDTAVLQKSQLSVYPGTIG